MKTIPKLTFVVARWRSISGARRSQRAADAGQIKAKQVLYLAESLARGTPHRGKIIATIAEDRIRELV